MRNHWLRKKVAREEFGKCICQIQYTVSGIHEYKELPLQLKINWINTTGYYLYVKGVSILDKNKTLIWHQAIGSNLGINAEMMLDFDGIFVNGYKAKDLFK